MIIRDEKEYGYLYINTDHVAYLIKNNENGYSFMMCDGSEFECSNEFGDRILGALDPTLAR